MNGADGHTSRAQQTAARLLAGRAIRERHASGAVSRGEGRGGRQTGLGGHWGGEAEEMPRGGEGWWRGV